jgi:O-antigen ligase
MKRDKLLPVVIAVGLGVVVLIITGLPLPWGLMIVGGLLLPMGALVVPAPRRFLEVCLVLSFGLNLDVHLGSDPTHRVDPAGIPVSLTGLLACALAVWWFIERGGERPRQPLWGGMGIPIVGLWATSICSIVVSSEPRFGLYGLINLAYFTLVFLYLTNNVFTRDHLRRLLGWLMLTIAVTSIVAVVEYASGQMSTSSMLSILGGGKAKTVTGTEVMRVGGLLGSPNALATVLVQGLPLMLAFFLSPLSGYRKPLLLTGLGVSVLALIVTYSRGSWLVFALILMFMLPLLPTRRLGVVQGGWIGKTVILLCVFAALAAPLYGHVYTRLTADDRGSAYSRLTMARVALRIIEDNPLFGVGLGNYENVMDRYDQGPERAHQDFPWPVHNIYLNITAEIGLLGGFCFLFVGLLAVWQGVRAMRAADPFLRAAAIGLMIGLVGFLLVGMKELGPLGAELYRSFWLAAGLLVVARRLAEGPSVSSHQTSALKGKVAKVCGLKSER